MFPGVWLEQQLAGFDLARVGGPRVWYYSGAARRNTRLRQAINGGEC